MVEAEQVEGQYTQEELVGALIERINASLKSNRIGEGKIFVSPIEDAIRTRTGQRGRDAIK